MSHPFLAVALAALSGALALVAVDALAAGLGPPIGLAVMGIGLLGSASAPKRASS
jgi:hypothetical protein